MKRSLALALSALLTASLAWAGSFDPDARPLGYSQLLDNPAYPLWEVGVSFVPSSTLEGFGKTGLIELDTVWEFAYYHDVLGGNIDMDLSVDAIILDGSADIQLPNQLVAAAIDIGWAFQYTSGFGLLFQTAPGLYSDIEQIAGDAFSSPTTLTCVYDFDPSLSGFLGAQVRPGFERVWMPVVGIAWEAAANTRLVAALPESRLEVEAADAWTLMFGFRWQSVTYDLREKSDYDRKSLTVEDYRVWLGARRLLSDQLWASLQLGYAFGRSMEFGENEEALGIDGEIEVDDAMLLRIAFGGPF